MIIKLELEVNEVNVILKALTERPFYEVYELINKIQFAGESQLKAQEKTTDNINEIQ